MDGDADSARDPPALQDFDARPHRGGDDEAQEDERDDEPQLPEGEREDHDGARDKGHDEGLARGLCQHSRVFSPDAESDKPDVVYARRADLPRGAPPSDPARAVL